MRSIQAPYPDDSGRVDWAYLREDGTVGHGLAVPGQAPIDELWTDDQRKPHKLRVLHALTWQSKQTLFVAGEGLDGVNRFAYCDVAAGPTGWQTY